jgi:FMN phosphatase YigB (HAD superfamily)
MDAIRLLSDPIAVSADPAGEAASQDAPPLAVRAFLFEAPGVLYDPTLWQRWLFKLLARMGFHSSYDTFSRAWDAEFAPAAYVGKCSLSAALESFLQSAGLPRVLIAELLLAVNTQRRQLDADEHPLLDVISTLRHLQAEDYAVAVTADCEWNAAGLRDKLDRLGLDVSFAHVTTSLELGCTKPDPSSYLMPATELHLMAGQVVFVGRRPQQIIGARKAGMGTIAVDCPNCPADWHVGRLSELLTIVANGSPEIRTSSAAERCA